MPYRTRCGCTRYAPNDPAVKSGKAKPDDLAKECEAHKKHRRKKDGLSGLPKGVSDRRNKS